jgi:hypothetical protein
MNSEWGLVPQVDPDALLLRLRNRRATIAVEEVSHVP